MAQSKGRELLDSPKTDKGGSALSLTLTASPNQTSAEKQIRNEITTSALRGYRNRSC